MSDREHLAVVVPKADAETKLDTLDAEGVHDDARKITEHDEGRVEIPVLTEPRATTFDELVVQDDPALRTRGLEDRLRERGWSDDDIARAPSSWAVVGDVVLVAFPDECPDREAVAEALLDLHGEAETVLAREGIRGEYREPAVSVVAGSGDTEVVHTEHGTKYAMDLAEVMFAPGNERERVRMGDVVGAGERVLDMFAGIGYFALPMARAGADVVAVEKNPTAFRYLVENAQLNGVAETLDCVLGDCREYEAVEPFDRVVMGYYDSLGGHADERSESANSTSGETASHAVRSQAPHRQDSYLTAAFDALGGDGVVHVHTACPEDRFPERPSERVRAIAEAYGTGVVIDGSRVVKSHSEGVVHGVLDVRVS